jgi:hypothetical protein
VPPRPVGFRRKCCKRCHDHIGTNWIDHPKFEGKPAALGGIDGQGRWASNALPYFFTYFAFCMAFRDQILDDANLIRDLILRLRLDGFVGSAERESVYDKVVDIKIPAK